MRPTSRPLIQSASWPDGSSTLDKYSRAQLRAKAQGAVAMWPTRTLSNVCPARCVQVMCA